MSTSAEGGTPAADQNKAIAEQFLSAFYQMFDTNRPGLAALYAPQAQLSYEGELFSGQETIVKKLTSLPFQSIVHQLTTFDVQLTVDNGLIVFAVGQLRADTDQVLGFSETFYLKQIGDNLFICNDLFRLTIHHQ